MTKELTEREQFEAACEELPADNVPGVLLNSFRELQWEGWLAASKFKAEEARAAVPLESVAWRYKDARGHWRYVGPHGLDERSARILKPEPLFAAAPPVLQSALSAALFGHVRTLRLSGRDDGLVEDIERAAIFLSANQPLSDEELNALWSEHAAPERGFKTPPWIRFARAILSAANQPDE